MSIHKYVGNVFTHGGQTSVAGFGGEILGKAGDIGSVNGLVVYAGYHGNGAGDWCRDFSHSEVMDTLHLKTVFPKAVLRLYKNPGMTNAEITKAVNKGNVFFTWCDSDNKVTAVMGAGMPNQMY